MRLIRNHRPSENFSEYIDDENLPGENHSIPENWPAHGVVEFKNVSASYTPNSNLVIRNLSISIKAGEKIGICGRSGSGKSSLVTTLFRMLEIRPESLITVDGIDITTLPRQVVRERLNAIPQEPFFIKGTIRFNIDPYSQHTDIAIAAAIAKVHLWPLVLSTGGLNTELDAVIFSHSQSQLFCLAPAILRKSKVIVLDEAMSSIDTLNDKLMQNVIREEFKNCTVIATARRLNSIVDFDRIALLEKGELLELETPRALLGKDGAFSELYNS